MASPIPFSLVLLLALGALAPVAAHASGTPVFFLTQWGSQGSAAGQFIRPRAVALDATGNVYVSDSQNHRIQKFDAGGVFLTQWGSQGSAPGQFNRPAGIAIDGAGHVYVADQFNSRIQKFDSSGAFLLEWSVHEPIGLACGASTVYASDAGASLIRAYSLAGDSLTQWSTLLPGEVGVSLPMGLAVDPAGDVYATDFWLDRVRKFDAGGAALATFGTGGMAAGQLDTAHGIASDGDCCFYVTEVNNHRVQKFTWDGAFVAAWGVAPDGDGIYQGGEFSDPLGVAVSGLGYVYVVDSVRSDVQKFGTKTTPALPASWGSIKARYR